MAPTGDQNGFFTQIMFGSYQIGDGNNNNFVPMRTDVQSILVYKDIVKMFKDRKVWLSWNKCRWSHLRSEFGPFGFGLLLGTTGLVDFWFLDCRFRMECLSQMSCGRRWPK